MPSRLSQLSALYVEDDDFTRSMYAQMLDGLFADLRLAPGGEEALAAFLERPCDLLVTDLQMPGMDGIQLCRELRLYAPEMPIIIISCHDEAPLLLQTANLGIDAYLLKPVDPHLLKQALLRAAERLLSKRQLEQAARIWSYTFDAIPDLIAILDNQYRVVALNRSAQEALQISQDDAIGQDYCLLLYNEGSLPEGCVRRRQGDGCCMQVRSEPIAILGGYYDVTVSHILDEQGQRSGIVHVARDVTEKALADLELLRSEARYRMLLNSGYDAIWVHGIEETMGFGPFCEVNEAACRMFGYTREELLALAPSDLQVSCTDGSDGLLINELLENGQVLLEIDLRKKDGTIFPAEISSQLFFLNACHQVLSIVRDCTERKRQEAKLQYVSTHDQLTGVYNRAWYAIELERLSRGRNWPISCIMVDLNELKLANDQLGHAAGDALLCRAVELLRQSCRADEMICRLGGDEFVILLPGTDEVAAAAIMARISSAVAQQNHVLPRLSLALGMATAADAVQLSESLVIADQRMYLDKAAYKGGQSRLCKTARPLVEME